MLDVDFIRQKIRSVLRQIKQLQSSDFPYQESNTALKLLAELYQKELLRLDSLDPGDSKDVRQQVCANANSSIVRYYHVLGFILRSTNVRNAFEIYDPLLDLCQTVYGSTAKLIVSSEWDFSPFTYPAVTADLPDLMFIGLPSTEAGNSLLVPLAGHELGHSVWRKPAPGRSPALAQLTSQLEGELTNAYTKHWSDFQKAFGTAAPHTALLTDLFLRNIWTQSYRLAERQTEELFCDLLGLKIFGECIVYSFIYLISPSLGDRAPFYPTMEARVRTLLEGAKRFAIDAPPNLSDFFFDPRKRLSHQERFVLNMADAASDAMASRLITAVEDIVRDCKMVVPTNAERDRILQHFNALCPPSDIATMADVINAGWKLRRDWKAWDSYAFSADDRNDVLNDLVFKSMEVLEYEKKTRK